MPRPVRRDFVATIKWGDGKASRGDGQRGNGAFIISGTHKYARVGVFTVRVTVTLSVANHAGASVTGAAQVRIRPKPQPLARVRPAHHPLKKAVGPANRSAGSKTRQRPVPRQVP